MTDDELIAACKEYILCDACGKGNPQNRCSRCHTVFYCDRDCQTGHWAAHKPNCTDINEMRAKMAGLGKHDAPKIEPDKHVIEKVLQDNPTCGICLEEDMENPMVLVGCHHCFCFGCIRNWIDYQGKMPTQEEAEESGYAIGPRSDPVANCPLCRKEMPNVSNALMQSAANHMAAAKQIATTSTSDLESQERCQKALADIEKIENSGNNTSNSNTCNIAVNAGMIRTEIYILAKDYEAALETAQTVATKLEIAVQNKKKIDELMNRADSLRHDERNDDEVEGILDQVQHILETSEGQIVPSAHVDVCLRIIEIQMLQEDWPSAKLAIQELMRRYPDQSDMTPQQTREVFTRMSRCAYELEAYDNAISLGEGAIQMNRFYPGCHKYVALAYKATGDLEKAQRVAAEAVVYETPWDDSNRIQVREFYRENFL